MTKHALRLALFAVLVTVVPFGHQSSYSVQATNSANPLSQQHAEDCGPVRETISHVVTSGDSNYVIADWSKDSIRVWNLRTRSIVSTLTDPTITHNETFAISPDNKTIITGSNSGTAILWDTFS